MNSRQVTLTKPLGWTIFTLLLFLDSFLDVLRGAEGNPLWKPLVAVIGIKAVPFLVPFILPLFYLVVKATGGLIKRVDEVPQSEDLVLTVLVVCYAVYDLWVIAADFFNFRLIRNHYQMVPILLVVGFTYALWAEYQLKHAKIPPTLATPPSNQAHRRRKEGTNLKTC